MPDAAAARGHVASVQVEHALDVAALELLDDLGAGARQRQSLREHALDHVARPRGPGGAIDVSMAGSSPTATWRAIAFWSSRTLPGHA